MGPTQERIPSPVTTDVCVDPPSREAARPNIGAEDYPVALGVGEAAARQILGADALGDFYYEALLQDPLASTRDALFTCYLHNWSGFNAMLSLVHRAALAELAVGEAEPERAAQLQGLAPGLAAGKQAFRDEPLSMELDILLSRLDSGGAPLTAAFVEEAYGAAAPGLVERLMEHAEGDEELQRRAEALRSRVSGPAEESSAFEGGIDWLVEQHARAADAVVDWTSADSLVGLETRGLAELAKSSVRYEAGLTKGAAAAVGSLAEMARHPVKALGGMVEMAAHAPLGPLWQAKGLLNKGDQPTEDLDFWRNAAAGLAAPAMKDAAQGDYAGAAGRAVGELAASFVGPGELGGAWRAAKGWLGRGAVVAEEGASFGRLEGGAAAEGRASERAAVAAEEAPAAAVEEGPALVSEELPAAAVEEAPALVSEELPVAAVEEVPAIVEEGPALVSEELPAAAVEETPAALVAEESPEIAKGAETTKQPQRVEELPTPAKAGDFDPYLAADNEVWAKAAKGGVDGVTARAELSLRVAVGKMSDAALEQLLSRGRGDARLLAVAERELAVRRGTLAAFEEMERSGQLPDKLGAFPKPTPRTMEVSRQVYALFSEAKVNRNDSFAIHVMELEDGSVLVGLSGGVSKVSELRSMIELPSGLQWADDTVPFRQDEWVYRSGDEPFRGGAHCGEPKTYLTKPPEAVVVGQSALWYGKTNRYPAQAEAGAGSAMLPCYSCKQHSERLQHNPNSVRKP